VQITTLKKSTIIVAQSDGKVVVKSANKKPCRLALAFS
jgi:hypothetical protein